MAIYKMVGDKERLDPIRETSFVQERIMEDPDLRYILRSQPEVIEEGLFVLSEEFSGHWRGSGRSIDLLGLDSNGRLVVIELKRTSTADHAELQAIRYAAMVSVLTSEDIVEAHRAFMNKWRIEGDAEERIQAHLSGTSFDDIYTESPRVVLVSEGFSKELTTSVLWLNDNGLDITCIQLQPYRNGKELLVESSQIVPVPGTEDLLVQAQGKRSETREHRSGGSKQVDGSDDFEKRIEDALPEFQTDLHRVFDWAVELEKEELTQLSTYLGASIILRLGIPGTNRNLATIYNEISVSNTSVQLWGPSFEMHAPRSMSAMESLIGLPIKYPTVVRPLPSNEFLAALRSAYREANGLPVGEENPEIS